MNRTRIKVCGVTRPEDAGVAIELGVDAIGIIVHAQSARRVDISSALKIRAAVPAFVSLVGVCVDAPMERARKYFREIGLDLLQLHGAETGDYAATLNLPYIKAIRAKSIEQISSEMEDHQFARGYLLDAYVKGQHGGTGTALDPRLWPDSIPSNKPLVLAGGLGSENLRLAVKRMQPFAVDLNSGVEESPGIKSAAKLAAAIKQVNELQLGS